MLADIDSRLVLGRAAVTPVAALMLPDGQIARDELFARGHERAAVLRQQGLRGGDLVICQVGGATPELSLMQTALALNAAALLPVADQLESAQLRQIAAQVGADWWWQPGDDFNRPGAGGAAAGGCLIPAGGKSEPVPRRAWPESIGDSTGEAIGRKEPLALVVQTSGSSGGRKAAMLSGAALRASCERINQRLGLGAEDLWLCALPRQHIGGLAIGYRCALAGAGMLLHARFDAARVAVDLWRHPVTHLSLVPAMLARLLEECQRPPDWLRVVLIGGQALDTGLARRALAAGWPLHLGYGMTETCSFIASRALNENGEQALEFLPDVRVEAPRCASGYAAAPLRLTAPMLMSGYANPERRPGHGLDDQGWLSTGDLACLSDAGCLCILGRADDQLVIAGVNVQPGLIEEQIRHQAGVSQCTLVGLPEPVWGQTLVALYQGTISVDALHHWCREHLPGPQRPRLLVPLEDWPLLASGKDDRARLRLIAADAWRQHGCASA
ncbi:AMP-binding protein [Thiorhodovibrio frisius]|nr:AMP-binding protein [Thiorhodovibrio frisius]